MADWDDCPNCGERVKANWHNVDGDWDGPVEQRPYTVPRYDGFHFDDCKGSFDSGAAVAFGLMGMAVAIGDIEAIQACPRCCVASGCWTDNICNQCWERDAPRLILYGKEREST
jgi:hypothetical protein